MVCLYVPTAPHSSDGCRQKYRTTGLRGFGDKFLTSSEAVSSQTGEASTLSPSAFSSPKFVSSPVLSFPLEAQKSEENFDLALIASLEIDVVPYLGDSRVPDYLILQLGKMLHSGSQVQQPEDSHHSEPVTPNSTCSGETKTKSRHGKKLSNRGNAIVETETGTTRSGKLVPRESFSYWCFDS
jgi:hypothetical protein